MSDNGRLKHRTVKPLKVAKNGNKRFWEESHAFSKYFSAGDTVNIFYDKEKKVFIVEKTEILGTHTIASRPNGKPILDIKNKSITELFENVEKVEILYYEDKLIVKVANVIKSKEKRSLKDTWKTYELFAGGGTLSSFFKEVGCYPIGGLELEDKYLYNFDKNHSNEDTYTISSRIEDVLPQVYPSDIDIVLAGIPCTNYSRSNIKLKEALTRQSKGEATTEDLEELRKIDESEALTFYVLEAIRAMNPRTLVVEEVVEYSTTNASMMLRSVLKHMGYKISETIITGTNNKRKRWCLVANTNSLVNLDNLLPSEKKTLESFLEVPVNNRDWKTADDIPRVKAALRKTNVGLRAMLPSDTMSNTFTTHSTRHTEPILKHPDKDLYSEFTNEEIKNIHGLPKKYILPKEKTIGRQILGQGVTNAFYYIAKRIVNAS